MEFWGVKWLGITGMCIVSNLCFGQDPIIFSNDRYSGVSAVGISPTQPFLNPNGWDIHVFSENIFLNSDYVYISKTSLIGLAKGDLKGNDLKNGITGENTKRVTDFFNHDVTGYHVSSDLMGPSFAVNLNVFDKNFTVGLFSKLRMQSSIIEVDNYLKYSNQDIDEPPLFDMGPFTANFMNWAEIGLNFSTEIFPYSQNQWIIGANLKYEMGLDAFYLNNKKHAILRGEYQSDPANPGTDIKSLYISDFDVEAGYATNYNFEEDLYEFDSKGKGFGLDIGIAMVDLDRFEESYDFKVSLNMLDLGYVNFTGAVHNFAGANFRYSNESIFDNNDFESPEQYAQLISNEIYGDPNESLKSNSFKIGLPTSIHLNLSKSIAENQFLNFNLIQRTPIFENSLKRANIANVSYSIMKNKIGYGASISAYEYESFQMGGFLRWGPLIIGSENILPFFIPHRKLHALDFYIGLKLYPMWDTEMKRRGRQDCEC